MNKTHARAPIAAATPDVDAAIAALVQLEAAQQACKDALRPAMQALVKRTFPVGLVIGLRGAGVHLIGGNMRAASHGRIEDAVLDHMDWSRPEDTAVLLRCTPFKENGEDMKETIRVSVHLLFQNDPVYRDSEETRRDVLFKQFAALALPQADPEPAREAKPRAARKP